MTDKPPEFHEEAAAEYEAAFDWYFERSRVAALKFAEEVSKALDLISAPRIVGRTTHTALADSCCGTFLSQLFTASCLL